MAEEMVFEQRPGWRPISRAKPKGPPQFYKTYAIDSPITTHYRDASCREMDCGRYLKGWSTPLDVSTVKGASTANWIRMHSKRSFTYSQIGSIVTFHFPPGQKCFIPHKVSLQRPEHFVVKGGDWRGNPQRLDTYTHVRAEDWVEDCALHQDMVAKIFNRG